MAAVNVTVAQAEIIGQVAAVVAVGLMVLLVYVALSSWRWVRDALGADDVASGSDRLAAAHARAAEMQAIGAGQSAAYAENAAGEAYDKGYYGGEFNPAWGEEARAQHSQAQVDRQADLAKGWK